MLSMYQALRQSLDNNNNENINSNNNNDPYTVIDEIILEMWDSTYHKYTINV